MLKFSHFHSNLKGIVLSFCSSGSGEVVVGIGAVLVAARLGDRHEAVHLLGIYVIAVFGGAQYLHRMNYSFAAQLGSDSRFLVVQIIIAG